MIKFNTCEMGSVFKFSKYLLIVFFCNLLVVVVNGQKLKEFIVNQKEHLLGKFEDSSGKSNYIVYPTLAYTPETRTEIGLVNLVLFYANHNKKNRLSEINTFSFYTAEKQYGVWLDHAIYGDGEKWFFLGRGKFQYFPMKYYGVGIKSPEEGYAVVSNMNIQLRERVLRKIKGNLFAGAEFDFQKMYNVTFNNANTVGYEYPTGYKGSSNMGLGLGLVYDNRKNVMNVRKGLFAELAFLNYSASLGSTNSFFSTQFDFRYFREGFNPRDVLAFQGSALFNDGDVPFNQMAMMGGESMMRGYYLGRFRDKNIFTTQAEYRFLPFAFSKRFGAAAFVSTATVAPTAKNLLSSTFKLAGGVGARYLIFKSKDIFVRFDVGFTREGNGYYFYIGEAF
ncbi:MAG: hypothetical protein RLZZ294_896 [Bacteroidota bacterium]